ncbi:precorrin-2 C(20)-methyltransferase [Carboxylicivirga sp. N1Y90]|uniref:precorrin-2 C(20)-methyltransferase n=1 Tax=Carboxylicivirga fragile TaxID=3417571 RepID=UPI003D3551BA|nr:precorrin-2 C(20)-methyltransferase [Marinilabiliaceae bacterium N1Y90]
MPKQGILIGVGLGPGDPELITLKGLRALENADLIFYPASEINKGGAKSYSGEILQSLQLKVPTKPLLIPMTGKDRNVFYAKAFAQIVEELNNGKRVVVVSEGDLLFYSTFGYIFKLAQAAGLTSELIPGVPAFIAAGSEGYQPIVEGNTSLKVMARPQSYDDINTALETNSTLVVMKMSVLKDWHNYLEQCNRPFFYIEKAGTSEQFSTTKAEDLLNRQIPYFSLMIFYAN